MGLFDYEKHFQKMSSDYLSHMISKLANELPAIIDNNKRITINLYYTIITTI